MARSPQVPSRQMMLDSINASLRSVGTAFSDLNVQNPDGKVANDGCLYAAYLHFLVNSQLRQFCQCVGAKHTKRFAMRRHNGNVGDKDKRFSFVEVTRGRKKYELHASVYVGTRSPNANLEVDVVVISEAAGRKCRAGLQPAPSSRTIKLLIEAKCYGKAISTGEAKEFIGLWDRIGGKKRAGAFVTNSTLTPTSGNLLDGAGLEAYAEVSPLSAHRRKERLFKTWLSARLRTLL